MTDPIENHMVVDECWPYEDVDVLQSVDEPEPEDLDE